MKTWLKSLERRLEPWAIPNITIYLVCLQSLCFVFETVRADIVDRMVLVPAKVMQGEVWRLITCVLLPTSHNIIFLFFELLFFLFLGTVLEREWGTLRYNLYLLIGYLATVIAVFAARVNGADGMGIYLEGSVFLAFAWLYPEYVIQLFLILPIKVKWLARLTWCGYAVALLIGGKQQAVLVLASVLNFGIFFGRNVLVHWKFVPAIARGKKKPVAVTAFHRCTVCGVTEESNRKMEFRYCPECAGTPCYCIEHIGNHVHRTQPAEVG